MIFWADGGDTLDLSGTSVGSSTTVQWLLLLPRVGNKTVRVMLVRGMENSRARVLWWTNQMDRAWTVTLTFFRTGEVVDMEGRVKVVGVVLRGLLSLWGGVVGVLAVAGPFGGAGSKGVAEGFEGGGLCARPLGGDGGDGGHSPLRGQRRAASRGSDWTALATRWPLQDVRRGCRGVAYPRPSLS